MHSHLLLPGELSQVMQEPSAWTARFHATLSSNGNPEALPAVERFPVTSVTHDEKGGYVIVAGDRTLTYKSGCIELHHDGGRGATAERISHVSLMYVPLPNFGDGGMCRQEEPTVLCVEFVHETRAAAAPRSQPASFTFKA